jgi:hypothetical protein
MGVSQEGSILLKVIAKLVFKVANNMASILLIYSKLQIIFIRLPKFS